MKIKLSKLLVFLFTVLAAVILLGVRLFPQNKVPEVFHVRIAKQDFWVPSPFFYRSYPVSLDAQAILLSVVYPEMEPSYFYRHKDERRWDNIRLLIQKSYPLYTPQQTLELHQKSNNTFLFIGDEYGLRHFTVPKGIKNGGQDLYTDSEGEIFGFLFCDREGTGPNPQCWASYWPDGIEKGYEIRISFDKDHLKSWPDMKLKIFQLLNSLKNGMKPNFSDNETIPVGPK